MNSEIKVNGTWLPEADENLDFSNEKIKKELTTEAGTTQVIVTRREKLTVSGSWTLSGKWMDKFREWARADMVTIECYWPNPGYLSSHECQFEITGETHYKKARDQHQTTNGLYKAKVVITEL